MARHQALGRIGALMNQMPFLRTADPDTNIARAVHLHGILSTAREAAQRYRTAVLAHDDLANRLQQLFQYNRPGVWNGYVPPRTDGYGAYNSSPYRQKLVAIVTEALNRADDWRHYDSDRLATVPERHIRAAWLEHRDSPPPTKEAGLWPESGP